MDFILIVEDDVSLAEGLCRALSSAEIQAESCGTLAEAKIRLDEWEQETMPLLILDVNLPDGNGFDFLKMAKESYSIHVIMLTANDMELDIVAGLEQGADDYITKPFSLAVLRARVAAQLRRQCALDSKAHSAMGITAENDMYVINRRYKFDFHRMQFLVDGEAVELSKTEQKLLRYFVENQGITLSRDMLIDRIWSDGAEFVDENALSVAVKRLRDKLSAQDHIKTVYGVGYVWKKEQ